MAVLLELDRASKSYGALKVADDLCLAVEDGEALAVIGPNGAGKSTMFNLITGDVAPDGGRILFAGADITRLAPHARSRLGAASRGWRRKFARADRDRHAPIARALPGRAPARAPRR